MIANILDSIAKDVNRFFRLKFDLNEDVLVLSHLQNTDGSVPKIVENKLIASLIGIEQERTLINRNAASGVIKNPPINLTLYVVFVTNFSAKNYLEALRIISGLISFFQGKQVFNSKNTPGMYSQINKITMEIAPLKLKELTEMWGSVGAKHMPSIIYKLRVVSIDRELLLEEVTDISGLNSVLN